MRRTILRGILALTLVVLLFALAVAQGTWVKRADAPVSGGYGEAIVGTCQYIYLVRELYVTTAPEFYRYDCQSNSWQSRSTNGLLLIEGDMPFRTGTALAWDGGNFIYALAGGRGEDKDRRLFFRYIISKDQWEILEPTPHPQGACDALAWSGFDSKLYTLLGSNELGCHFAVYDPHNNTWNENPPERWSIADDGASLAWGGGEYIYALHGEAKEGNHTRDFARYHIPSQQWEDLEPIPQGVDDGGSLIWIGNLILNRRTSSMLYLVQKVNNLVEVSIVIVSQIINGNSL
jgi:hypothetical protein